MPLVELSAYQLQFLTQLLEQSQYLIAGDEELEALPQVLTSGLLSNFLWSTPTAQNLPSHESTSTLTPTGPPFPSHVSPGQYQCLSYWVR